ncbi:tubby C-terminal-like domain-containing protein [Aspergillus welwitschiae]|uniref:Tubby C-terminal-like domain-containing protein n=1 Tax=Aspergillus welwitschiae TaxID=1341132 RepID=A0A3F3PT88_9EURO|nr:tubby C-terminal-like domain-containing protein [Aspergillus welwitschiae]RDH29982.1 tubby C-terminal-like domain-containing protein [Aspergillus welwitschiae]
MSQPYLHPVSQSVALFEQFIATEPQVLVLKEKVLSLSGDSFDIRLGDGVPILKVTGTLLSVSGRKKVEDMDRNHLFDIRKEHMHVHTTYVLEDPDGNKICEVRSSHKFIGSKATATCTDRYGKQVVLVMTGNWNDRAAHIVNESTGEAVARISRKRFTARHIFFGQDTYNVIVAPGVDMALVAALSVSSAILGASTLYSLGIRTWRLFKSTSNCRPRTSESRWNFDFFHWNYLLGFVLVTIIIVVGLTEDPPSVRMTALPPSILLVQVGLTLVIVGILAKLRIRQPFAVSSMPAGTEFRPGILVIIEDVVAVDGGRGRAYRSALMERYAASLRFRRLIEDLNWFWGFGGLLMGIILICILASVGSQTFAFGLGWTVPWIWAGVWAVITTYWVKSALREEKLTWSESQKVVEV